MKPTLANIRKLAKLHSEGVDVQEQVQHWIDTETEPLLEALGVRFADEAGIDRARDHLRQPDGWARVLEQANHHTLKENLAQEIKPCPRCNKRVKQ